MDDRIRYAVEHTELVRPPQQQLATFGNSIIDYWVVTELTKSITAVRDGKVIAERPRIVTPAYLTNVEGFSEQAKRYIAMLSRQYPDEPGVFYRYKNEAGDMSVISEPAGQVLSKLDADLQQQDNPLSAIIKGVEELWDVSLLLFVFQLTRSSISTNIAEFQRRGFLYMDSAGLPGDARNHIEELFELASRDLSRAPELVRELNRWRVFAEYQDRFFALFRSR